VQIFPLDFSKGLIPLHNRKETVFGRQAGAAIEMCHQTISRRHATIEWVPETGWQFQDCGSANGSYVNERRVDRAVLQHGDQIRISDHVFKFLAIDHVEAIYHETVYQMMTVDALTQVCNRRYFEDAFEREVRRSQRHGRPLAVLMFDVDDFKSVNDQYGHLVGDLVLQAVCQRVRRRVRKDELFARYGGEEFVVVLAETTLADAVRVADDLRKIVAAEPVRIVDGAVPITISVGVSHTLGLEPVSAKDLLAKADGRLYDAKHAGRNCVRS
jgi:diguanylate cyclase (GGDEF)-like protein